MAGSMNTKYSSIRIGHLYDQIEQELKEMNAEDLKVKEYEAQMKRKLQRQLKDIDDKNFGEKSLKRFDWKVQAKRAIEREMQDAQKARKMQKIMLANSRRSVDFPSKMRSRIQDATSIDGYKNPSIETQMQAIQEMDLSTGGKNTIKSDL